MNRFARFCILASLIAGLFLGYGVGYFVVATECVELYHQGTSASWADGFQCGYERGLEDMALECIEAIKDPKLKPPEPIRKRPKPEGPQA